MTAVIPQMIDVDTTFGYWRVWFYPGGAGGPVQDVTFFRNAPTTISSLSMYSSSVNWVSNRTLPIRSLPITLSP